MAGSTPTRSERQRVRDIFEREAPKYDRQISFFEKILFGGGREWVCSQARGKVLELACGTARNLPFYGDGVELTGIELSPGMLAIARQRAHDLGHPADLRLGDAQALELFEASGLGSAAAVPAIPSILPLPLMEGPSNPSERVDAICGSIHRLAPFRPSGIVCLTGPAGDLLDPCPVVALLGEHRGGGIEQAIASSITRLDNGHHRRR